MLLQPLKGSEMKVEAWASKELGSIEGSDILTEAAA